METILQSAQGFFQYLETNGFGTWQEISICAAIFLAVRLLEGAGKFGVKHVRWRPRYLFELFRVISKRHGSTGMALGTATLWLPILDAVFTTAALPFGFYLKKIEKGAGLEPESASNGSKFARVEFWKDGHTPKTSTECIVVKGRNIRHGVHQKFRRDGSLAAQGEFKNDKPSGVWEYFNTDGSRKSRREH